MSATISNRIDAEAMDDADGSARWRFYRAVWRWHFLAGLLVLPVLLWMALTGAGFVYHNGLDRAVHHSLLVVKPVAAAQALPPSQLLQTAQTALPGPVFRYTGAASDDASAQVGIVDAQGRQQIVYLDPSDGRVLGQLPDRGTLGWTLRRLHSLEFFGDWTRAIVEMAAGWAIILLLSGVYLWWPRGRRGGVLSVRGRPRQRLFWRDLHAMIGIIAGAGILFLALTGMPWSWCWGAQLNKLVNGHDFGYPAGVRTAVPMSDQKLAERANLPWSLRQAQMPESMANASTGMKMQPAAADTKKAMDDMAGMPGMSHGGDQSKALMPQPGAIGVDAAAAIFDQQGMGRGYSIDLPKGPHGVYSATLYNGVLEQQRVIHLDQYSGRVLVDVDYAHYGPLARLLEWVINVHMGDQFGSINRLILLLICLATVTLCVSAAVMWWTRRPAGQLGVPQLPDRRTLRVVMGFLIIGGLLFPLTGLTMLLMWLFERRCR